MYKCTYLYIFIYTVDVCEHQAFPHSNIHWARFIDYKQRARVELATKVLCKMLCQTHTHAHTQKAKKKISSSISFFAFWLEFLY